MSTPREHALDMVAQAALALEKVNYQQEMEFRQIIREIAKDQTPAKTEDIFNDEMNRVTK